jgi:uncharacterized membrane protein
MRHTAQRWLSRGVAALAAAVLLGCPADNGTQPGTLTLSITPTSASVQQGASTAVSATATSGNGFSGTVTFAVSGAPTGVTASVTNVVPSGSTTTATVTINAAASTAPGTYNLTIRAQGSGVADGTAAFALTVTATPDYALSLAPAALTIDQGANGNTTVTINRTNFTGAVTLSLGGAAAGITGAFAPAAPTGTTSTLTVTVGAAVTPGTYNLTVDGTGAPGNRSTALTLTVAPAPDYSLSMNPAAFSMEEGSQGGVDVNITRTNFTGAVTLTLGNAPPGVTGTFTPAAPTGTTSSLTLTVALGVAPGTYNLTVDGAGTPGNRSVALPLTVIARPPDFTLAVAPPALTIVQGASDNSTVTITRTNFTGAVTLSLGNAPAGVTGAFAPAAPTGTTSTLTVTVGAAVTPGTYNLTVDGTGTPGNRSTPLTLTVQATPDYALSINPTALTINQGANDNTAVTITRTNFTGAVTLSLGNAPAGVTGAFVPAAPTGTTSTLTVTVGTAVTPGTYNLTVDGTGTPGNRSTPLTLTVAPAPDYSLAAAPSSLTIQQGANDNSTITITRTNFTGAVTLSLGNAPAGVTGTFVPAAPTGTTSTLTVAVAASVAAGTYNLTIDGTATVGNKSTPLTLTVTDTPDYSLSVAPTSLTIVQGANDNATVTITRTNFTDAVTLSLGGAPAGVTGAFVPAAPTGTSSTLTVSVAASVTPGTYNLTVDGTGTPGNRSTPLTLTVAAPPDYALSVSPTSLTIQQNANSNTTVTITRTNFTDPVTLSLGNAPAGVTGSFAPAAPTGTSSTLTVSVGASVAPGTYNLTVDGTGTPGNRSTPLTLTVTATPDYSLSVSPTALTIAQNANANTAVTITRTNFNGAVTLSLGGAPAGVTGSFAPAAPTGTSSTLTVSVGPAVTPGTYNLSVDGAGAPGNRSTALSLTVTGGGGGNNVSVSFAACPVADRAVWLAYQDGNGAWTRVVGVSDVYTFGIASGTGGIAYVVLGAGNISDITVHYMTQAEMTGGTVTFCGTPAPVGRTISGTAAGLGITDQAQISLGGRATTSGFFSLPFQIVDVPDGTHDLVGFKLDQAASGAERGLLRRDVVVSGDASLGTVDFAGSESFAATSATITVGGLLGGELLIENTFYHTGASCDGAPIVPFANAAATFTAFGMPGAQQRVTDFHRVAITAIVGSNDFRSVSESFHTMAARTITLGASLPAPTISSLIGPYKRLQAAYTVPADYQNSASFQYVDAAAEKSVNMFATSGYLGGSSVSLALADFSGLAGWDNTWAPAAASTGNTSIGATGGTGGAICAESARLMTAGRTGTY